MALVVAGLLLLSGCSGFLHDTTARTPGTPGTPGGGTTPSTGSYAFVGNTGSNTVTGLNISTAGMLTGLPGSPISLTLPPTALTVSRTNTFLWVGTVGQIFGYAISPAGAISSLNGGAALANANCVDMQTSPDGKWLMVLDGGLLSGTSTIDLFAINANGTLSAPTGFLISATGTVVPRALRINPAGTVVAAALGTAGEALFSFNTGTGVLAQMAVTGPPSLTSDNGIAFDGSGTYLYLARSGSGAGLVVTAVGANGALTPTTSTPYPAGMQPYAVALDATGSFAYVANRGDGTITGYAVGANAALGPLAGAAVVSGAGVTQLATDATGKWLLAAAYGGTPDLSLYGYDATTPGKLDLTSSIATGTNAALLAVSH